MENQSIVISKKVVYYYSLNFTEFAEKMKEEIADITDAEVKQYWEKLLDEGEDRFVKDNFGCCVEKTEVNRGTYGKDRNYVERSIELGEVDADGDEDELKGDVEDFFDNLRIHHEEERWSTIYYQGEFAGFCGEHPHLQDFKTATYYQTYGGGPEGGYLLMPDKSVYKTERTWGTPFSLPEKVDAELIVKKIDGEWKCRLD